MREGKKTRKKWPGEKLFKKLSKIYRKTSAMESVFLINLEYNIWQHSVLFQRSPSSLSTEVQHTSQKPDLKHQRGELILRSSHPKVFCKRGVLGNFAKFKTLAQVFSCELCKISKNTFFTEHVWATASE